MTTATTDPVVLSRFPLPNLIQFFRKHAHRNIQEIKEKEHKMLCTVIKVMESSASSLLAKVDLEC
jgi:hypothetical protein